MQGKRMCLVLLLPLLAACRFPQGRVSFPDLGELSDEQIVTVLRQRTAPAKTLYAELALDYQDPDREGSFEGVFSWQSLGTMRMTAFKDLIITTRYVFDIELTQTRFSIEIDPEGDSPTKDRGPVAKFKSLYPRFSTFFDAREAMFLPGTLGPTTRVVRKRRGLWVHTRVESGAEIVWKLAPRTLRVLSGTLEEGGTLTYGDYIRQEGAFIPQRMTLVDARHELSITARVKSLEVNPED